MISKDKLEELLLGQRLTVKEVSDKLRVHRNTLSKLIKKYEIDTTSWWSYQSAYCTQCGVELDPDREYNPRRRKALLTRHPKYCEECKVEVDRVKNRDKQRRWREKNRRYYNKYMREYRQRTEGEKELNEGTQ